MTREPSRWVMALTLALWLYAPRSRPATILAVTLSGLLVIGTVRAMHRAGLAQLEADRFARRVRNRVAHEREQQGVVED